MSGKTEFPHLHFAVRRGEAAVDPFIGATPGKPCGPGAHPLWRPDVAARLPYRPTAVYNAGFAGGPADAQTARAGGYGTELRRDAAALVLWTDSFNVRAGDRLLIEILGPKGETVVEHATDIAKDQSRRFVFAGRRAPLGGWREGEYRGSARLVRPHRGDWTEIDSRDARVTLR
jgi:hypothetical protein